MSNPDQAPDLAHEAWGLMFDYLVETNPVRARALGSRGLTPNDGRALWQLDDNVGTPIGSLARDWECDPSNATFIVDRLAKAGLAARRSDTKDGRVKLVFLTPLGVRTKQELMVEYRRPPANFTDLPSSDLEALIRILRSLACSMG
jgi:DNA-binding MarR family transcriptional regulator